MQKWLICIAGMMMSSQAFGQHATAPATIGYYQGQAILYPYDPVYCDDADGRGPCYGGYGALTTLPESAPLPKSAKWCEWADTATAGAAALCAARTMILTSQLHRKQFPG